MKQSISDNKKSRGRPATTGTGVLVGQRWHGPDLKKIDEWAQANGATRTEAIRRLVELGLLSKKAKGKAKHP
jgi:hypothetical protein